MTQARNVVLVGASAGGVQALQDLVAGLPGDLQAAVLVVLHMPRTGPRALAGILDRAGPLPVQDAADGTIPLHGRIFVAQPDHHLVLRGGRIRLTQDDAVDGHRPSIDVMFRSAARLGPRLIAVVLTGAGGDGAAGLATVVAAGAVGIVQDPGQAEHASMPEHARASAPAALVRRVEDIGPLVGQLVRGLDPVQA